MTNSIACVPRTCVVSTVRQAVSKRADSLSLCALVMLASIFCSANATAQEKPVSPDHANEMKVGTELFVAEIRPILVQHCLKCHGGESIKGDFDLSTRQVMLESGMVEPGDSASSQMFAVIAHSSEPVMPKDAKALSSETVDKISKWIDLGAPFDAPLVDRSESGMEKPSDISEADRQFWSFQPLHTPAIPNAQENPWIQSPIDAYIWDALAENGIRPSERADRRRLIRRAYFDLIGLPPTPDQVQQFQADTRSDTEAYAAVIDELLKSPHYGERWARHWMDIARFAESHGYEQDYDRPTAYHYRDFLIKALNQDLPYNEFVRWQIAGDEIAPENPLAWSATGFLGAGAFPTQLTETEFESARYDELDDMVGTMGTAILGLSIGCARCHTHKFDPIPVSDYYSLVANFATTIRCEAELDLEPEANQQRVADYQANLAAAEAELERYRKSDLPSDIREWLNENEPSEIRDSTWNSLKIESVSSSGDSSYKLQDDGSWLAEGASPSQETLTFTAVAEEESIAAIRLETLSDPSLPKHGPGRAANGNFALGDISIEVLNADSTFKQKHSFVAARATHQQNADSLSVAASIDSDRITGWAVDAGGIGKSQAAVFDLDSTIELNGGERIVIKLVCEHPNGRHVPGRIRLSAASNVGLAPAISDVKSITDDQIAAITNLKKNFVSDSPEYKIVAQFLEGRLPAYQKRVEKVESIKQQGTGVKKAKVLVASEGLPHMTHHADDRGFPHFYPQTYVLARGDANQKRGPAEPGYLRVLMAPNKSVLDWRASEQPYISRTSYRRTGLANWLTDTENGAGALAARVIVNRVWQHHFGNGLVATPSDFGVQGDKPTHPQLLEWLAQDFVVNGWQLKRLHRLIMTSSVYMQNSQIDDQHASVDRENRMLWHFPARRLEGEAIRDSMLSVAGLLDTRMYGPGTLDSMMHRRSIYYFIKRSQLIPFMLLFDWPEHLVGIGKRATTTVAPQALALMNSPECQECATALAKRVASTGTQESVEKIYQIAFGRDPTDTELRLAKKFLDAQADRYSQNSAESSAEMAMIDLCRTVLSMNEMIYVD